MKKAGLILLVLLSLTLVSGDLAYNNPNLPRVEDAISTQIISGGSGSGSNVTSVSSGDGCIIVSPITGDVIITFNTSCASTGGDFFFRNFTNSFNINLSAVLPLENRTISHISNITGFLFNYNQTIDRNIFNQNLNTTNNVQFVNITTTDKFLSTLTGVSGIWHQYFVLGTAIEIGRVTSELGVFQIRPSNNFDIYFSNDDATGIFGVNDLGQTFARSNQNFFLDNAITRFFESNATRTTISSNLSLTGTNKTFVGNTVTTGNTTIKGAYHDWAVPNGFINATGVNITSNHQTYDITSTTSFDTNYNNTHQRVVYLDVSFEIEYSAGTYGYAELIVNGSRRSLEGVDARNFVVDLGSMIEYHHMGAYVQPGQNYSINTVTSGISMTIDEVFITVI